MGILTDERSSSFSSSTQGWSYDMFKRELAKRGVELDDVEMVQRWRVALTKVVNFPGSLCNDGEREKDIIMKIPETVKEKVIPSEGQPALCRPTMYPKEDQPARHGPIVHQEEDQPALHRLIFLNSGSKMPPEEDQPAPHWPTTHAEEDHGRHLPPDANQPSVQVFRENCDSVVEIYSGSKLMGSGFMWDMMGHIVTNWHVIENASDLRVAFINKTTYDAKVRGFCKNKDVAVLHAEELEGKVKLISIGPFANLLVGQPVFAIGSPYGYRFSLTTGVISGLCGEILSPANKRPIQDVIQIDAALNPGNSGGPLFDSAGSLIGINTAGYTLSGASCGLGFSISIHSVRGIIDQLVRDGKVLNPHLGITLSSVPWLDEQDWLLVIDVAEDGPAAKAGIRKTNRHASILGDIITSVNGQKVTNSNDLFKILDLCEEGDKVTVGVLRGCREEKISVTLELNPDESESDVMPSTRNVFKG